MSRAPALLVAACPTAAFAAPAAATPALPLSDADGKYSDPEVLAAAFTRFENHEGITSLLYTSQRKG
jgi:hypothetical protein